MITCESRCVTLRWWAVTAVDELKTSSISRATNRVTMTVMTSKRNEKRARHGVVASETEIGIELLNLVRAAPDSSRDGDTPQAK